MTPSVSFVIPTLNEEGVLDRTLSSIRERVPPTVSYEVYVVDDGSVDGTVRIAREHGVNVIESTSGTVGGSRNEGAEQASGDILIFLDADVVLTQEWGSRIVDVLRRVWAAGNLVAGSHCGIPEDKGWIEEYWFEPFSVEASPRHLGTGHMLLKKAYFAELGGFDPELSSGEDYEFCMRVTRAGGTIENCPELRVEHLGYPKTIGEFVRREAWHGSGDTSALKSVLTSKVALAALLFAALHLVVLAGILLTFKGKSWWIPGIGGAGLLLLLVSSVLVKFPWRGLGYFARQALLMYVYYAGRFVSFLGSWESARPRRV